MEGDVIRCSRDDQMNYHSFCSNYQPSRQSRKISIGIVVDSLAKWEPGVEKRIDGKQETKERENSISGKSAEEKNKGVTVTKENHTKAARSCHQNLPTSETAFSRRQSSSLLGSDAGLKKLDEVKDAPATCLGQNLPDQITELHNDGGKLKFDVITYKRKGQKNANSQREDEFTFATAKGESESDKVAAKEKTNKIDEGKTETLKMKLWEILGTVSSPKNSHPVLQASEVGPSNLKPVKAVDHMRDTAPKCKDNSDTIEMDTESPDNLVKKPATRSLARKKAPSKVKPNKRVSAPKQAPKKVQPKKRDSASKQAPKKVQPKKPSVSPSSKQKHLESFFCFDKGQSFKVDGEAKRRSSISEREKLQTPVSGIAPRKIRFSKDIADDMQKTTYRSRAPVPPEKTSLFRNKIRNVRGSFGESRNHMEKIPEKDSHQPPMTNITNEQENFENPTSPENGLQQEGFGNPSKKDAVDPEDGFKSPTFGAESPISSPSLCLSPKHNQMEPDAGSPTPSERRFTMGNIRSFKNFQTSRDCFESNDEADKLANSLSQDQIHATEKNDVEEELSQSSSEEEDDIENLRDSSPRNPMATKKNDTEDALYEESSQEIDDSEKLINSSPRNPVPTTKNNDAEDVVSESSSEEKGSESSEEGSPIFKRFKGHIIVSSAETIQVERPKVMLRAKKRLRHKEDFGASQLSPTLPSQQGTGDNDWFKESLGQSQDDDLLRAVTLFASALENFKRKMDSAAKKKSSEILMSMSEEIKLQLQNTESQIESDVGKLSSLGKSKRKRLETRFQEQQEQLKAIHEKFKEDIHHHLLDCQSTIEGLEAHQNELKGTLKKHKVSQQKLLMQAEEAVQVQLSNAEKQIMGVHESAKGKMLQLKRVIAEFLKEDA